MVTNKTACETVSKLSILIEDLITARATLTADLLEPKEANEKPENGKTTTAEFKRRDWVSCTLSKDRHLYFAGIRQIKSMHTDGRGNRYTIKGLDHYAYHAKSLQLVCGFTRDQTIGVCLIPGDTYQPVTFIQYRPELEAPYECVDARYINQYKAGEPYRVDHYTYAGELKGDNHDN